MANKIPAISKAKFGDAGQQRNVDTMANAVDTLAGRKGNGLDRAVLVRDLHDLGIARVTTNGQGRAIANYTPPTINTGEIVEMPEAPKTEYMSGIDAVFISWDEPVFQGFLYAEIFRGKTNNVKDAVLLDRTAGILYADNVGWADVPVTGGYYYWVRFVNTNGEFGPFDTPKSGDENERHIAPTQNPRDIIDKANGMIEKSALSQALNQAMDDTLQKAEQGISDAAAAATKAQQALSNAAHAQSTADGKIVAYYQTNKPTSGMGEGDIWFDTDDNNKQWIFHSGTWKVAQDKGIGNAINLAQTAQTTADGKVTTFYQTSAPHRAAKDVGDLWVDTDDNNKLWRWSGTKWQDARDVTIQQAKDFAAQGITRIDNTIGGLYTVTVAKGTTTDGKPLIGGFGIGADPNSHTVDAGFNVDNFWVGKVGQGRGHPFIITNGKVMISSAVIDEASINHAVTNTMIANKLTSQTINGVHIHGSEVIGGTFYVPNKTHPKFSVDSKGIMHAVDGIFSGQLQAATGTFSGALSAATGTFTGELKAATGTFKGTVYADSFVGDVVSAKLFPVPSFPSGRENVPVHIATIKVTNRNSTTATLLIPSVPLFAYALTSRPGGNGTSHATGKIEWFIREDSSSGKIISHDVCSATHSITVSGGTVDHHSGAQTTSILSHQAVIPIAAGATKTISIDAIVSGNHSESTSGYGGHFAVKTQNIVAVFYRDGGAFS